MKYLKYIITAIVLSFFIAGCNKDDVVTSGEQIKDENATGAYDSMKITYHDKYEINFKTKSAGHPSGNADFETDISWKNDQGHGTCNVDYFVMDGDNVETDYKDYDELEEIILADRKYKVIREDDRVTLLHKLDDYFYIEILLSGMVQFNENGEFTDVTYSVSDLLDDGCLEKEIVMDIVPLNDKEKSIDEEVADKDYPIGNNDEKVHENNEKMDTVDEWKNQFIDIIKDDENNDNKYALVYIDADDIPELVVDNMGYYLSIYTYSSKDEDLILSMDKEPYGTGGCVEYYYDPHCNMLSTFGHDQALSVFGYTYYEMKSDCIVGLAYSITAKCLDEDGNLIEDTGKEEDWHYYYDDEETDKEISEDEFDLYEHDCPNLLTEDETGADEIIEKILSY